MPASNVFGEQLSPGDDVLSALQGFLSTEIDIQLEALQAIMNSALSVIQRQLKSFLTDPEPSPEMAETVTSAPSHNMASERVLGCLDQMMR